MVGREFKEGLGKVDIFIAGCWIGKKVIELENIFKFYNGRILIKDFIYEFVFEDRVGIIGSNGMGKLILMDIIIGRVKFDFGKVEIGIIIYIGYFD